MATAAAVSCSGDMRNLGVRILGMTVVLGLTAAVGAASAPEKAGAVTEERPNIVFILADDLGYGDLGCYGQERIATPHIDRLAADGMRFTRFYAGNASCAPSRSSLLTGKHTGHVRHRDNRRFVHSYGFAKDDVTFAEVLREAGYATAICGKWHLGDRSDSTDIPHHHGFDHAYCIGHPYPERGWEHWPSHVFVNGAQTAILENGQGRKGRWMDDLYTDAALAFMREQREGRAREGRKGRGEGRPFVVMLSLQGVHAPMDGKISPTYAGREWPEAEKVFASMLERVDHNVGRVVAELKALGIEKNTVVFFTSDNGPHDEGGHRHEFFKSNGPWRGHKFQLYEGGLRVPFIAAWPGTIPAGATNAHVGALWDMLPTFAELGRAKAPSEGDGISLMPTLLGRRAQGTHEYLYWESQEGKGSQAVRWGKWKAVRRGVSVAGAEAAFELYDLENDPGERMNVAGTQAEVVRRMREIAAAAHVASPITPLLPGETAVEFVQAGSAGGAP